jgi:uncharacterized protein with gpF-like domain
MKRFYIVAILALCISGFSIAQEKLTPSQETMKKVRQIDLLNHLLPLVMTKDQIRKLLPTIEKARRDVKLQIAEEDKLIAQYAAKVDKAVQAGVEKGDVPDAALLKELNALIRTMSMKREAVASDNTNMVLEVLKTTLNSGQLKAAGNSLDFKTYNPGAKTEEIKDEDRLKLFVREVVLDPYAYDIMTRMLAGKAG